MSYANEDERQSVLLASTAGIDVELVPRNLELDVKLDTDATPPSEKKQATKWIGHSMSRKFASTFARNAKSVSACSSTRQESCKIGWRGAEAATGPDRSAFPSGKEFT
jgi:hypothetical protein